MNDNQSREFGQAPWAALGIKDYVTCRQRFLDSSVAYGGSLTRYVHPGRGPLGEELTCDIAHFGNPHASRVVLVTSGTHGIEGRAGSAVQSAWIESAATRRLADDVAVVLIHAINPYGFAFERRNEATNVDPNRNFASGDTPFPDNAGYRELHPILCPAEWTPRTADDINAKLEDYSRRNGFEQLKQAVSAGQREYPAGLFYAGTEETWPVQTIKRALRSVTSHAMQVAYVDLHTGMGRYAETVYLCFHAPGSAARGRAKRWFGASAIDPPTRADGQSERYEGTMYHGIERLLVDRESTIVCVEFGTAEPMTILGALLLEHWLHFHGGKERPENQELLRRVRQAFIPPDAAWLAQVTASGIVAINNALLGLTSEPKLR